LLPTQPNASKKTKVLHLITRLPVGGAEKVLVDVVRSLDPARYESLVCCIQAKGELAAELEKAGVRVLCLDRMQSKRFDWRAVRDLTRLLRAERITLVHSHLYHANLYGRIAALLARVPAVATVHNVYARSKFHRRLLNRLLAQSTARVIAVSEEIRGDLVAQDRIDARKVVVVHNGIDVRRVESTLTREQARARLGIGENDLAIGCVARLEQQKGHRFLLEACAALRADADLAARLRLLIVGDGRLRGELEIQARALALASSASFLGTRQDVPDILRALDIYVMPSLWEGLSIAMLEAMAAALPIVISDVSGAAQALGDNEHGIRVPPGNAAALADALRSLAREPGRRRALATSARKQVQERFSIEAMMSQLGSIYDDALGGRHA
jgi:glycosyltransferase involved in cell wall biosynthesis